MYLLIVFLFVLFLKKLQISRSLFTACSHSQIGRNYTCIIERDLRAKDVVTPNKQLRLSLANLNRNVRNCYSRAIY